MSVFVTSVNTATRSLRNVCLTPISAPVFIQVRGGKFFNRRRHADRWNKENRPKAYFGFVNEVIDRNNEQVLNNLRENPDYRKDVLREARKRKTIYDRKKMLKALNLHIPIKKQNFTDEQITHIKLLHEEDPSEWNVTNLARSLNVDENTVSYVLKKRYAPLKIEETTSGDSQSTSLQPYSRKNYSRNPEVTFTKVAEDRKPTESKPEINNWFKNFRTKQRMQGESMEAIDPHDLEDFQMMNMDGLEGEDHMMELYWDLIEGEEVFDDIDDSEANEDEYLNDNELNEKICREEDTETSSLEYNAHLMKEELVESEKDAAFELRTKDNVTFYDQDGRFVFKLV